MYTSDYRTNSTCLAHYDNIMQEGKRHQVFRIVRRKYYLPVHKLQKSENYNHQNKIYEINFLHKIFLRASFIVY